jgi:predicted acylesterase/phospholipase RssA
MAQADAQAAGARADPTGAEGARALRDAVLAQPGVRQGIAALAGKRVALVLSGGGGKGAYEAGAMLALFDCGLRDFCAIAGTSVGALNGALFHQMARTGDRDFPLRFWSNLTQGAIMRFDWRAAALKLALLVLASPVAFSGSPFLNALQPEVDAELHTFRDVTAMAFWRIVAKIPIVLLGALVLAGIIRFGLGARWAAVVSIVMVFSLPQLLERVNRRVGLFSNAPLRALIETVDIDSIRRDPPPVLCTLATPYQIVANPAGPTAPLALHVPLGDPPERAGTVDLLVQTAAIPEVFPARRIGGHALVDGGVADNTPILAVARHRPDLVVVVYLNHRFARVERLAAHARARMLRLVRARGGADLDAIAEWSFAVRLVPIIPSEDLGGLFTGTLNFRPEQVQRLIRLGYEDALRQIQRAFP